MREERRDGVVQSSSVANPQAGMSGRTSTKPYVIAKRAVWEAYQQVKANRGAAGIDEETIAMFEQNLSKNLYKLWNRMSSGSYFPPPVRQVEIPKAKGGTRKLGIPTVSDRIAQTVVKQIIEPKLDPMFHADSYGYRPGRSAKQAIAVTRKRCWQFDWVVEFDIKGAFDQIDHGLLTKAVRSHIKEDWILLYIERWLSAPFESAEGTQVPRERGTPQGGVVSPILMNLFMHYAFDVWMKRTNPSCPFARYADDAVVHCSSKQQAEHVMRSIAERLTECGLTMHPEKSKIVYCQDSNRTKRFPHVHFTFLGFTFRPRKAISKPHRIFTSFLPAVSFDAVKRMRKVVRGWRIPRQTPATLAELARQYNSVMRGWWEYYGAFYQTAMREIFRYIDSKLEQWARRKYKTLSRHKRRSVEWLDRVKKDCPGLFAHWRVFETRLDNKSRVN
jgi:group II intron reverse transcriptase/maturase